MFKLKYKGVIRLHNIKTVTHENNNLVAVSRSGEVSIVDDLGRERERYKVPYGAVLTVQDNQAVEAGQIVANGIHILIQLLLK